jgi:hypothetical protein
MGGLLGGGSAPAPVAPPPPPAIDTAAVQNKARDERLRLAKSQGRSSTILTGGQGTVDEGKAATKTLLGQ